jgi:hypothetical protein
MKKTKETGEEPMLESASASGVVQEAAVAEFETVIASDDNAGLGGTYTFDPVTGIRTREA